MAYEKSPAEEYTRDEPLVVWIDGATKLELFTESSGVSSAGPARISNPHWVIRAKGAEHLGWEATVYESEREVLERARAWWQEKQNTL